MSTAYSIKYQNRKILKRLYFVYNIKENKIIKKVSLGK